MTVQITVKISYSDSSLKINDKSRYIGREGGRTETCQFQS